MKVTDCSHIAGLTLLSLSEEIPKGPWRRVVIDGESHKPLVPMYAGDVSRAKDDSIGIQGEYDFAGKDVEFV